MRFFLGTHHPGWLASAPVPLFVSDRRLRCYRRLPRAVTTWALDSGGFTELSRYGSWEHGPTPAQYVARIRRYVDEIGMLVWAAPQDWMCEPWILAKTELTLAEHQRRTVANFVELRERAADAGLPDGLIRPVVQGWESDDYLRCVEAYHRAGVDLTTAAAVGLGTVCRRQGTATAGRILAALHRVGVTRLHGFGFKVHGLARYRRLLASADSLAWSYSARREPALPGCTTHRNCANCPRYAYRWHRAHIAPMLTGQPAGDRSVFAQPALFGPPEEVA